MPDRGSRHPEWGCVAIRLTLLAFIGLNGIIYRLKLTLRTSNIQLLPGLTSEPNPEQCLLRDYFELTSDYAF